MFSKLSRTKAFLIAFAVLLSNAAGGARPPQLNADQMMSALFDGPPRLAQSHLDPAAYVEESVWGLTNPSIAYINWEALEDVLREMGFTTLPSTLTPELSRALLSRAAFAKPLPGEASDAYTEDLRVLYSIRYGGHWINYNFGSGRNGASGVVDIKGIGRTSLVRPWADGGHSSGGMGLREAIKEAIWSNILHHLLPNGANRVLFVMTTGTLASPSNPQSEARAILVREDPLRPAYFQRNDGVRQDMMSDELRETHTQADILRMERLYPRLIEALPKPRGRAAGFTAVQKLRSGLLEMVDRIAETYAFGYASQIVLAGATTSNVEIDGRALDYGVTTAVIGYPRVNLLSGEAPNGSTETLKNDIVLELAQDLREDLPAELVAGVPTDAELAARVDERFRLSLAQAFLEMAGTPKEYSRLVEGRVGREFGETLILIAQAGNSELLTWEHNGMPRTGTYNVENVLKFLLKGDKRKLSSALPEASLRQRLVAQFQQFKVELQKIAAAEGVTSRSLDIYMNLASAARARSIEEMRSGQALFEEIGKVSQSFTRGESPTVVQEYINAVTARNIREHRSQPFELSVTVKSTKGGRPGDTRRIVFNLKTGVLQTQVERASGFDRPVVSPTQSPRSCGDLLK